MKEEEKKGKDEEEDEMKGEAYRNPLRGDSGHGGDMTGWRKR